MRFTRLLQTAVINGLCYYEMKCKRKREDKTVPVRVVHLAWNLPYIIGKF